MLGALCTTKGPEVFLACRDEILKNVSENLERKLPDPCEVAEGLVYKLTGAEKDTEQDTVSILALKDFHTLNSFSVPIDTHG